MISKWRKTMIVLSTTLLSVHVGLMPLGIVYAGTTEEAEGQEPIELPSVTDYLQQDETSNPRFFFTQSRMQGMVEEPLKMTFFSDQEVSEARVTLPKEAQLLKDKLPAG
ncbi:hypothetical protein, partial [Enterococcus sp. DIV0840c]|uniref:hypothetical protein n=1 Tax=Enterococcus sp. DIV0840c TaxID=2774772 RepID=UPI003D2E47DF